MARAIEDSVIVVTGASSGIGQATARALAEQNGTVVLVARREDVLHGVADECENLGGRTYVVPADVRNEEAVQHVAQTAIEQFGRLDAWVNNAAVSLFGRIEEVPSDAFRAVIETNLFGYVYGIRAALPYMREQGSGVIVNVASVVSNAPQPYTSAYVASKYAIRGLTECLRMELALDRPHDIHACTVMPASIDTPLFQHAANYTGRAVKALEPVYPASKVAEAIAKLVERPQRERIVGNAGRFMTAQHTATPGLYERMMASQIDKNHLGDQPASPTAGNLFEPMPEHTGVSGGWRSDESSSNGRAMLWAGLALVTSGLAALALR